MTLLKAPQRNVVFIHIPRTGGISLSGYMRKQFKNRKDYQILKHEGDFENFSIPTDAEPTIRFVWGHMYYGLHKALGDETTYFTFVRDPFDRLLSMYNSIQLFPSHRMYEKVVKQKMSFEDFVFGGHMRQTDNGQVRLLAGNEDAPSFGQCGEEDLKRAKENIDRDFFFVGLTEKMNESMQILFHKLGQERYSEQAKVKNNATYSIAKKDLSIDLVQRIQEFNQWDGLLYQFASERYEKDAASFREHDHESTGFFTGLTKFWKR